MTNEKIVQEVRHSGNPLTLEYCSTSHLSLPSAKTSLASVRLRGEQIMEKIRIYSRGCAVRRCCSFVKHVILLSLSGCLASLDRHSSLRVNRDSGQVLVSAIHSTSLRFNYRKENRGLCPVLLAVRRWFGAEED